VGWAASAWLVAVTYPLLCICNCGCGCGGQRCAGAGEFWVGLSAGGACGKGAIHCCELYTHGVMLAVHQCHMWKWRCGDGVMRPPICGNGHVCMICVVCGVT
jgi:hypothetical protein